MARARLALLMLGGLALAPAALAQSSAIGRYKDWRVFTEKVGSDLVCFAAVEPADKAPKDADHGEVNFYVATWKSGQAVNQPSLKVGYPLRTDLAPQATIGRDRFPMYASGPEAFLTDKEEKALIAALKKGTELRIEAASIKNKRTAYHFSLKGSTEAIDKARQLCK
jgi:Invasion associated locus B (IalB) protein